MLELAGQPRLNLNCSCISFHSVGVVCMEIKKMSEEKRFFKEKKKFETGVRKSQANGREFLSCFYHSFCSRIFKKI